MKAVTALRTSLILFWVLAILGVVAGIQLESRLPPELQLFRLTEELSEDPPGGMVMMVTYIALFLVLIVSSVALFKLHRWGAWAFAVSNALTSLMLLFFGPTAEHPAETMMDDLSLICSGIAIGIAFFGNVFGEPNQP